jgi:phage terminase large subunit-like protein
MCRAHKKGREQQLQSRFVDAFHATLWTTRKVKRCKETRMTCVTRVVLNAFDLTKTAYNGLSESRDGRLTIKHVANDRQHVAADGGFLCRGSHGQYLTVSSYVPSRLIAPVTFAL